MQFASMTIEKEVLPNFRLFEQSNAIHWEKILLNVDNSTPPTGTVADLQQTQKIWIEQLFLPD